MKWDVFISHAAEDKTEVVLPLFDLLVAAGLRVWLDKYELHLGDSLRAKIDEGLAQSRFGIVVLSQAFFAKDWPQRELNGLAAREIESQKVILPIWHKIDHGVVAQYSPLLADRLAVNTNRGLEAVKDAVLGAMSNPENRAARSTLAAPQQTQGHGQLPEVLIQVIKKLVLREDIERAVRHVLTADNYPTVMKLSAEAVINPIWRLISSETRIELSEMFSPFGSLPPRIMHLDIFLLRANDKLGRPKVLTYYSGKPVTGWQAFMLLFRHRRPGEPEALRQSENAKDISEYLGLRLDSVHVSTLGEQFVVSVKPDPGYSELVAYVFEFCRVQLDVAPDWLRSTDCTLRLDQSIRRFRWLHPEEMEHQERSMLVDGDVIRGVHYFFGTTLPAISTGFPAIVE